MKLEFNEDRAYEALDMKTLAQLDPPSNRTMADRFEIRHVSTNGGNRWNRQWVNVTTAIV